MLTLDRLKQVLNYPPETGGFTWAMCTSKRIHVGDAAGAIKEKSYRVIRIDTVLYRANRLAWFWMTGKWPEFQIDHRDGNSLNDRFVNLRDVTATVNGQNQRRSQSSNKAGFLGVTKRDGKYLASIFVDGKSVNLGRHLTPEAASLAYIEAKRKLHEGCTI